ncbi:unnamed protein product [Rotaria sp. Silwood1]|nr:unnamed protein product [Rotaria sp. Silwood1]
MISNIYLSDDILSTNQCFICQKEFSFGELILRDYDIEAKKYIYYHPTCLQCIKFDKVNIHNYGQLLFERLKQHYKFEQQQNDLTIDDENYHGLCYDEHVIDIRKPNDCKKTDLNSSLTCCRKDWNGIYEINPKQCSRCHKTFTRFDIYQTNNHIDYYCNICWIYQKEFIIKNQTQSSFIRCNLCGKFLLDQLTDDIISMNFVHPECLEKHLNDL